MNSATLIDSGYCFACGPLNPIGLKLSFTWEEASGDYTTTYVPALEHQGWAGRVHGGLIAVVFDEVLSRVVLETRGQEWVTAEICVRLIKPVAPMEPLVFRSRLTSCRSRLSIAAGEATNSRLDTVARGTIKMMRAD